MLILMYLALQICYKIITLHYRLYKYENLLSTTSMHFHSKSVIQRHTNNKFPNPGHEAIVKPETYADRLNKSCNFRELLAGVCRM